MPPFLRPFQQLLYTELVLLSFDVLKFCNNNSCLLPCICWNMLEFLSRDILIRLNQESAFFLLTFSLPPSLVRMGILGKYVHLYQFLCVAEWFHSVQNHHQVKLFLDYTYHTYCFTHYHAVELLRFVSIQQLRFAYNWAFSDPSNSWKHTDHGGGC